MNERRAPLGSRIRARRTANDTDEVTVKLTLVVESDKRRDVGSSDSVSEEYLRARDADFRQKSVGRQTQFSRESSAQVKLIRPRMFSEILEAHTFGEVLEQERTRSSNTRPKIRCRSCTRWAEKRRKRCEGLGDSNIESKAILHSRQQHEVQLSERTRANVERADEICCKSPRQSLIEGGLSLFNEPTVEGDELERPRSITPYVAVHLARLRESQCTSLLHTLAAVHTRHRTTTAGKAKSVVGLHTTVKLRGFVDP